MAIAVNYGLIIYLFLLAIQAVIIMRHAAKNTPLPGWFIPFHCSVSLIPVVVFGILVFAFVLDQFQFYLVWSHSAKQLPLYYKIAATWEGQEGSFLLWASFQAVVSMYLIARKELLANYAVAIILFVQLFLILPLVVLPGSSSTLFSDTATILNIDPQTLQSRWLLQSGNGMNPLLQNLWMTVHPPVIFMAFTLAAVPFAITLMGIGQGNHAWLSAAQKWMKLSLAILTAGILMGAFWAYETLNFGGYWSWDPVENAILLPWLAGIAALHSTWAAAKSEKKTGLAAIFNCAYFLLIVYSTFLTRSGILQDTSVHAFVENGNQDILTTFLASMAMLTGFIFISKRKQILFINEPVHFKTKQEWILIVVIVLTLGGIHIFINTSIPVFNHCLNFVGLKTNLAPPTSALPYAKTQGLFALCLLALLLIVETSGKKIRIVLLVITAILSTAALRIPLTDKIDYPLPVALALVLLSASLLVILIKKIVQISLSRLQPGVLGAALSHLGFVLLLAGSIFSSNTFNSKNDFKKHSLLSRSEEAEVNGSNYSYEGKYIKDDQGNLISTSAMIQSMRPDRFIAKDTIRTAAGIYLPGSVIKCDHKDLYFKIINKSNGGTLLPHIYFENLTNYFATPSILKNILADTYLSISNFRDNSKIIWKDSALVHVQDLDKMTDPDIYITSIREVSFLPRIHLNENRKAFMIHLQWQKSQHVCHLSPIVVTEAGQMLHSLADLVSDEGIFAHVINWKTEKDFQIMLRFTEKDWITIQAEHKSLINLFWSGGILMTVGIALSMRNRNSKTKVISISAPGKKIKSLKESLLRKPLRRHVKV